MWFLICSVMLSCIRTAPNPTNSCLKELYIEGQTLQRHNSYILLLVLQDRTIKNLCHPQKLYKKLVGGASVRYSDHMLNGQAALFYSEHLAFVV